MAISFVILAISHALMVLRCDAAFIKSGAAAEWIASGSPITYSVDSKLSSAARHNIDSTLNYINSMVPGLQFASTTSSPAISFILDNSRSLCEDEGIQIGKSPYGLTYITITETPMAPCGTRGWIMHLVLHALGFYHEHQRTDRNQFIYVNYPNSRLTAPAKTALLDIVRTSNATVIGPYDLESVMHYDYKATAFAAKMTILSMPAEHYSLKSYGHATNIEYSAESVLSVGDIMVLRSLFPSPTAPSLPQGSCLNGGWWYNWCLCKPGFAGKTCDEVYCNHPCQHGGTCEISIEKRLPVCSCPKGFSGNYCEVWPNSNATCDCPWWGTCNARFSTCNCDPYPYTDQKCSEVISNVIPTTSVRVPPPAVVIPTTPSPPAPPTTPQLEACDDPQLENPRRMATTPHFIYLRLPLKDIPFISDYADLSSWNSAVLQFFITEGLQTEYHALSNNSFQSILLTNIQSASDSRCTVVDFLVKFDRPLTPRQRAILVDATLRQGTISGPATSKTSRIGSVKYIDSANRLSPVSSPCSTYDAEGTCKNGGSCSVSNDNKPDCNCPDRFEGDYCDERAPLPRKSWPTLHIVVATLGGFIALLLFVLLIGLWRQGLGSTRSKDGFTSPPGWSARLRQNRYLPSHKNIRVAALPPVAMETVPSTSRAGILRNKRRNPYMNRVGIGPREVIRF